MKASLAIANIVAEPLKFLGACLVVTLAALVAYLIGGPLGAQFKSIGQLERNLDVDLIVSKKIDPDPQSILMASLGFAYTKLSHELEFELLRYSDIIAIQPIVNPRQRSGLDWNWSGGETTKETLYVFEQTNKGLGVPSNFSPEVKELLRTPGVVVRSHRISQSNNSSEYVYVNDLKLGVVSVPPEDIMNLSGVIVSKRTAELIGSINKSSAPDMILILVKPGVDAQKLGVAIEMNYANYKVEVSTPEGRASSLGATFMRTSMRGFLIANLITLLFVCVITGLTLRSLLLSYKEQFGCLRALGVTKFSMSSIAMELSLYVVLVSIGATLIGAYCMMYTFRYFHIPFSPPSQMIFAVAGFQVLVGFSSGLIAVKSLVKIEPVELLR